jgi:hypothetical protein
MKMFTCLTWELIVVLDGVIICYHNIHEYCKNNQLAPNGLDFDYFPSSKKKYYVKMLRKIFSQDITPCRE